jgi:fluoride exporter
VFSGDRRELAAIFAGWAAGGGLRTLLEDLAPTHVGQWPWSTFSVNIVGCLLLGLLDALHPPHRTLLILETASIGSYTTFSTWMLEAYRPAQDGEGELAWLTLALTLAAGFVSVIVGRAIGRQL